MMLALKVISKIKEVKVTCFEGFLLRNNIDFEIKNLCLELKRKEIEKYNPLHYAFGYELISKEWLDYGGKYE